jgi:hypothetical protein
MLRIPKKLMNKAEAQGCGKSRKGQWDQPEYRDGELERTNSLAT